MKTSVIALFDIGKTNKKLFLIDEHYRIVLEKTAQFAETTDEDGDSCEDLTRLTDWVLSSFQTVADDAAFDIRAINFSAYGASFVLLGFHPFVLPIGEKTVGNTEGSLAPVASLYNYLKPLSADLQKGFYEKNGGEAVFSRLAASPVLGNLNSGMQLYRLKNEKPDVFQQIKYALHLPQYLSFLFSKQTFSDITSIGCHTNLWDFDKNQYADWVAEEGVLEKLAPIFPSDSVLETELTIFSKQRFELRVGVGLHDSSAALIPYLMSFQQPFILISTGTWCISMNPFDASPLTDAELENDCLCYLSFQAQAVKSARLFAGFQHEEQTRRIAKHFNGAADFYKNVDFDPKIVEILLSRRRNPDASGRGDNSTFATRDLADFDNIETAYHQLIHDIMTQQVASTRLVLRADSDVQRVFVDGGFSKNRIYMNLLAAAFPDVEVFAASVAQASAIGAALAIHRHWNPNNVPSDLIDLTFYATQRQLNIEPQIND